ncbi:type IV toxin-antitoxin system AbiEi family antitoxin domain-containing protein [Williamsia sp. CHRR-6]|uniref:type IV toxin-antitoxin system AbiEi family antitoxin domain-containing protein n=1 Tax=Williamsia sp. CHRR-6 TaxID=2835871 RepID=UPI001BD94130|nr:type IV toxin-antitoxin system AbiEi family antitoxin domain-containing protein [Williamsia sp. CHRR-6]MBT0565740.1 type IV toxin-antitoxin system AbiEi family antitoxin domain-containing protein [Williamsia sp. CHRR-6]
MSLLHPADAVFSTGVFTTAQLHRGGSTDNQIRRAVAAGDLIRLRPGWYARVGADPRVVAAVTAGGVLSCVSALAHHGVWVSPGYSDLHVRRSKALRDGQRSCQAVGPPRPTTGAIDSVAVALGCAVRCMRPEDWIAACDSALNQGLAHGGDIVAELGPRGRDLLARCDARSESGTESLARVRLRAVGFAVIVQPQIEGVGRVDLRVGALLIECDSVAHHTSLANYRNDRRRDRAALVHGWLKIRLTYDDVVFGWDETLEAIRAVTVARRHRLR